MSENIAEKNGTAANPDEMQYLNLLSEIMLKGIIFYGFELITI